MGSSCSFLWKENQLCRNRLFTFRSLQTPFRAVPCIKERPLSLQSLWCMRKILRDKSSRSRRTTTAIITTIHQASPVHLWGEDALQSTFASIPSHLIIMTSPGGRQGEYYYQHFTHDDARLWGMEAAFFTGSQSLLVALL